MIFVFNSERGDIVNDQKIIEMLFARSESALTYLQNKFEKYCHTIAYNILGNDFDAQECVNDTYLRVWNSIPPDKPKNLSAYIGHIARNVSIDLLKRNRAKKRGSSAELVLEELSEIISDESQDFSDAVFMRQAINSFLENLPTKDRRMFVQRYWYAYSVKTIAESIGRDENYVNVKLHRLRSDFKKHLEKEGIDL